MKSEQDVDKARSIICDRLMKEDHQITPLMSALLKGMLCGLIWVNGGEGSSTVQRILDGEPFA